MNRFAFALSIVFALSATSVAAQQMVPPASPTFGASGGFGGGIAIPIGSLADTHAAGYTLAGLVDFSAADQPYSFRAEATFQRYDRKTGAAPEIHSVNMGAAPLNR